MQKFFSTQKVAAMCHVSRGSVIRWINDGKLKAAVTAGGHNRVRSDDLISFLQQLRMPIPDEVRGDTHIETQISVLVVDDEESIRRILQNFFKSNYPDFYIDEACDGFEAGIKAEKIRPQIIILDVVLPGLDGFRVCKCIRQNPGLRNCKILAITGFKGEQIKTDMLNLGADDLIMKPFTPQQIKEKIEVFLSEIRGADGSVDLAG